MPTQVSSRGHPLGADLLASTSPAPFSNCFFISILLVPVSGCWNLSRAFSYFNTPSFWPTLPHQTCCLSPVQSICVFWIHTSAKALKSWVPVHRRPRPSSSRFLQEEDQVPLPHTSPSLRTHHPAMPISSRGWWGGWLRMCNQHLFILTPFLCIKFVT